MAAARQLQHSSELIIPQGSGKQQRIVRDDRVHACFSDPHHFTRIVDRPGDHLFILSVNLFHQSARQQPVMRNDVANRQSSPAAELPSGLRQSAQDERIVQRVESPHDAGQKGRNEIVLRLRLPYSADDNWLDSPDLHLNIQECPAITFQHLFQTGRRRRISIATFPQLLQSVAAQNQLIQFGVVTKNGLAIACAAYIKFESVSAVLQGKIKGSNGILRRVAAGATMPEKQNS